MTQNEIISALTALGDRLRLWLCGEDCNTHIDSIIKHSTLENEWFTVCSIKQMLAAITTQMLDHRKISEWLERYKFVNHLPKRVGIIAAGNIPLVFFHDFICVLMSQNIAVIKFSSKDKILSRYIIDLLADIDPRIKNFVEIADEQRFTVDCVIATGSSNTLKFFEGKYENIPHVFRKSRTSVAVINGNETAKELELLSDDIFSFFGLGCRNVSKIFIPDNYNLTQLADAAQKFSYIKNHELYRGAYQYNKALFTMTQKAFIDNDFWLLVENSDFFSPVSVVYYEKYTNLEVLKHTFETNSEQIQCIVNYDAAFGQAQQPKLTDYADGIDIMNFLLKQI